MTSVSHWFPHVLRVVGPGMRARPAILAHVNMFSSLLTNFPNPGYHHVKCHVTLACLPSLCSRSDANCSIRIQEKKWGW